ncbi:MAG: 1,4-dihydroxy-6-naphthoate synthase [Trichlorobacter sp.]|nr:1,4-dihydroxy-6-naphthoate synthase [Trichlorobacter sp.]
MHTQLTLGFSPCPNDTFMFYPLVHGLVKAGDFCFKEQLEDVETLNRMAMQSLLDISKVSYAALGFIRDEYVLLRSGSALGRGCGPLLVAGNPMEFDVLPQKTIAIPGAYTTACMLLRLFNPRLHQLVEMPFDKIMPAVASGAVDAGVIIHESRFTYQTIGLHKLLDLGSWWEAETGLPIPLGGIVARRSLGTDAILTIEQALRAAVDYSRHNPAAAARYISSHAQEMSSEVCAAHIGLYVNDFSSNLGEEGEQAICELLQRAEAAGIVPACNMSLFAE